MLPLLLLHRCFRLFSLFPLTCILPASSKHHNHHPPRLRSKQHDLQCMSRTTLARARVPTPSSTCPQERRPSGRMNAPLPGRARPAPMITRPPALRAGRRSAKCARQLLNMTDRARMPLTSAATMPRCAQPGGSSAEHFGAALVQRHPRE